MGEQKTKPYQAYLLRCWQGEEAAPGKEPLWRFSVEEILPFDPSAGLEARSSRSGQGKLGVLHERRRKGFGSLEALFAFLQAELASSEEGPSDDGT